MFTRSMKWGWLWLTLYALSTSMLRFVSPTVPTPVKLAFLVSCVCSAAIVVYLIHWVRHTSSPPSVPAIGELSAWGYCWRGFLLLLLQIPMLLLIRVVIPFNFKAQEFTAAEVLLWLAPFAVMSAVGAWLLFSTDRRGQLRLIARPLRGY